MAAVQPEQATEAQIDALSRFLESDGADDRTPAQETEAPEQDAGAEDDEATAGAEAESPEDEEAAAEGQDAGEEGEPEESGAETFEVPGHGTVTLQELTDGFLRQADYTQKTQAVADDRRALDSERATARQQIEQQIQRVGDLAQQLTAKIGDPQAQEAALLQRLRDGDVTPEQFLEAQANARDQERWLADKQREIAALQQEQLRLRIPEERRRLIERVPEWADDSQRAKGIQTVMDWAQREWNVTPEELAPFSIDHRFVGILRQAWMLSEATRRASSVRQTKPTARRIGRAGSPPERGARSRRAKELERRARSTGNIDDAVDALFAKYGDTL